MDPAATPRARAAWTAARVVLAGALLAAFLLPASAVAAGPVLCPCRAATGLPCPGCGLTRSFVALAHGFPGEAWHLHPFGPLAFAACLGALLVRRPPGRRARRAGAVVVVSWVVWALVRAASLS